MPVVAPRQIIRGHADWVRGVVHLRGGQYIITGSRDGSLRQWDLKKGTQMGDDWRDVGDKAAVWTIALSPDGNTVASGSWDGTVRLWDVKMGNVVAKWTEHAEVMRSVCWNADGKQVVSGSLGGMARVWDVQSGERVLAFKTGHQYVFAVICSPDSTKFATGGFNENAVKIWDTKTGELVTTLEHDRSVCSLAWTSDGKRLISGSISIRIFDTATWREIAILEGHKSWVRAFSLSRDNRLLASTSSDNTARLWNIDTNLPVGRPLQHPEDVHCVAFSADGKLLATGCEDNMAYVWDIYAILREAALEVLLPIPDADDTQGTIQLGDAHRLPQGYLIDDIPDGAHSSATRHHSNTNEIPQLQQRSRQNSISRHGRSLVGVAAQQDKRALVVAPRPQPPTAQAKRTKNPKWWVRIVLFLCCVSTATGDNHCTT